MRRWNFPSDFGSKCSSGSFGRMEQRLMASLWGVWKNTKVRSGAAALGVLGNDPVVKCQEGSTGGGGAW